MRQQIQMRTVVNKVGDCLEQILAEAGSPYHEQSQPARTVGISAGSISGSISQPFEASDSMVSMKRARTFSSSPFTVMTESVVRGTGNDLVSPLKETMKFVSLSTSRTVSFSSFSSVRISLSVRALSISRSEPGNARSKKSAFVPR